MTRRQAQGDRQLGFCHQIPAAPGPLWELSGLKRDLTPVMPFLAGQPHLPVAGGSIRPSPLPSTQDQLSSRAHMGLGWACITGCSQLLSCPCPPLPQVVGPRASQ